MSSKVFSELFLKKKKKFKTICCWLENKTKIASPIVNCQKSSKRNH